MMEQSASERFLRNRKLLWFVLGLTTFLFAIGNLPWRLDDYDQAKQAFTSFEMVKEGHWLYQRTPNERVATKPPLVGWISAALFAGTKSWAIAWRLPVVSVRTGDPGISLLRGAERLRRSRRSSRRKRVRIKSAVAALWRRWFAPTCHSRS